MSADIIQVQYEKLASVAKQFAQQAEATVAMRQQIERSAQVLRQGGWQGRGSTAFFAEMDGTTFPTLHRLISALTQAQKVTIQVSFLLRQAEEEAARPFKGKDGAAPVAVADPKVAPVHDPSRDREYLWGLIKDKYYYKPTFKPFDGSISPDGVSPADINQGSLGDCYFLAAMATIAGQHPEVIWNAIKDNGDGTYTVTFYKDGQPVPITVDSEFPVREDASGNATTAPAYARTGSQKDELWPMIMEKAYAQMDGNSYKKIEGGWPGDAVEVLTGKPPQKLDLQATTPDQTRAKLLELQNHLDGGNYLTVATRSTSQGEDKSTWPNNVVPLHAYSVDRIDVEKGLVYLRNPWGSAYNPAPMTLEEFNKYYPYVAVNK